MTTIHISQLKEGDQLIADGGFTCIPAGQRVVVKADEAGLLYVPCSEGAHYLCGQLTDEGLLIGLTKSSELPS